MNASEPDTVKIQRLWEEYILRDDTPWNITFILIWIVGVLGNLVNIIAFSIPSFPDPIPSWDWKSRSMNLLLRWLAVSELFELFALALWGWCQGWNPPKQFGSSDSEAWVFLLSISASHGFQTIAYALNVLLAVWRYYVIAYPNGGYQFNIVCCLRIIVFFIYILGFVVGSLALHSIGICKMNIEGQSTFFVCDNLHTNGDDFLKVLYKYIKFLPLVLWILLAVITVMLIFGMSRALWLRQRNLHLAPRGRDLTKNMLGPDNILVFAIISTFTIFSILPCISTYLPALISRFSEDDSSIFTYYVKGMNALGLVQILALLIRSSYNIFIYFKMGYHYRFNFLISVAFILCWPCICYKYILSSIKSSNFPY